MVYLVYLVPIQGSELSELVILIQNNLYKWSYCIANDIILRGTSFAFDSC
jgi:hypothetical protein